MALLVRMLKQQAVYWAPLGVDGFGKPTYGIPIQIKVRWEDSNEEVLDANGEKTLCKARIFSNLNVLQVRGVLVQGQLTNTVPNVYVITDQNDPYNNRDDLGTTLARRIIKFDSMGDLRIKHYLRIAYVN